ncbi:FtsQ-type POTRA domain-containing protein [Acidithrix sp. C25]|uniref:cell division protein FtsQ/DivIB n=1 Tax=Acidithrix sp. C25 TaxID=1671482 RepID=UPI00191BA55B|nr:FtsQ-type POTRA domain-containing protein [Acidithrix sp. C25]CAG4901341.1 unnamed protein product [Acidithrix sp. C25]
MDDKSGIDPRIKRRRNQIAKRFLRRRVAIALASLGLFCLGYLGVISSLSIFKITKTNIVIKGTLASSSFVSGIVSKYLHISYFSVPTSTIQALLLKNPKINSALVEKKFPNTLDVLVTSAQATFVVATDSLSIHRIVIGQRGQVLPGVTPPVAMPAICKATDPYGGVIVDFNCATYTSVSMVKPAFSRIAYIEGHLGGLLNLPIEYFVFPGTGVGFEDSNHTFVYISNQDKISATVAELGLLEKATPLAPGSILDLTDISHPSLIPPSSS